jgi:hypothetical protein
LEAKLNSSMVMIKRIKGCLPKSEYIKVYNALFMSLSYCISRWSLVVTKEMHPTSVWKDPQLRPPRIL